MKELRAKVLQGHLQEQKMSGTSTTTPSNDQLLREFKDEGTKKCALKKVAQRLKGIQVTRENEVD